MAHEGSADGNRPGSHSGPIIERFTLGPFETNCYLVYDTRGPQSPCWVVDASFEPAQMVRKVQDLQLRPEALILTHAHVDHIAGVNEVLAAFPGTPVWIHQAEADWLQDPMKNLSSMMGQPITAQPASRTIGAGDLLKLQSSEWTVLHTPGHSPGGITLHCAGAGVALVGDSLFAGSIGRTDFPGSSFPVLERSIREQLYRLPGETRVLPGHGPETTVQRERLSNPFVRG
jgi:glyoxylase-like metal-dependent hydrolase (beta-lactamase superfamily II)